MRISARARVIQPAENRVEGQGEESARFNDPHYEAQLNLGALRWQMRLCEGERLSL